MEYIGHSSFLSWVSSKEHCVSRDHQLVCVLVEVLRYNECVSGPPTLGQQAPSLCVPTSPLVCDTVWDNVCLVCGV